MPILVVHQSGHLSAANSKALEIGGITASTANPGGGVIQRRDGGTEPNGVLEETAHLALMMKLLGFTAWRDRPYFKPVGNYPPGYAGYPAAEAELAENISPIGWCVQRGMRFTSHHDAPVAFPDSMRVLDATVTRRTRSGDILGPRHRVDVMTALEAMTLWPAWQHFEERSKGSIEVGKLADFVILDKDPTAVDPETLDTLRVVETLKEGTTVFRLSETNKTAGGSPPRQPLRCCFCPRAGSVHRSQPRSSLVARKYLPLRHVDAPRLGRRRRRHELIPNPSDLEARTAIGSKHGSRSKRHDS